MGDWRAMGQGVRRRMGKPSAHSQGARNPSQLPRFVNYEEPGREAGRPEGTTKDNSIWDEVQGGNLSASYGRASEDQWTRQLKEESRERHPAMRQKKMKPQPKYFG